MLVVRCRLGVFSYTSRKFALYKEECRIVSFLIACVSLDFQISLILTTTKSIFYKIFGK